MRRTTMLRLLFCATSALLLFLSCEKDADSGPSTTIYSDFSDGEDGWQAGFSEYSGNNAASYELEEGIAPLPPPLNETKMAYRISGMNRSDDLFMYLTKRVQGLEPRTTYKGRFTLQIAS